MSFESKIKLKDNEQIIDVIHRYGLTFFWSWLIIFILIVAPFFFMFWLFNNGLWGQILFVGSLVLGLFVLFRTIFIWQKNVLLITTHRIVDFDRQGFFEEIVSNVAYDQMEDVMGKISGLFGTIFRYGNVTIQSGNGKVQIIINKVKYPTDIQQEITEVRDEYMTKHAHDFSGNVADAIIDKLYELEQQDLLRVKNTIEKRLTSIQNEDADEE
ncbi:MAG TPA: hypothetical protein DEB09_03815 [Candidatus Magasanikbacteria bacterium]|nr:hypothetical protein [Candidatus Magasanikbacteria bacterium]